MNEKELNKKIEEYIVQTDCPIKDPNQLLHDTAIWVTGRGKQFPYEKVLNDFYIWYVEKILKD